MICSEWSYPESLGNKNFRFHFRFFLALLIALIFGSHAFGKYKCLFFYTSFVSSYICPRSLRDSQAKVLEVCACVCVCVSTCVCLHACVCVCLHTIFDYKKKKKKKNIVWWGLRILHASPVGKIALGFTDRLEKATTCYIVRLANHCLSGPVSSVG